MSPAIWSRVCSTSFIAAKIGRSGQPTQKPGGQIGTVFARSGTAGAGSVVGRADRRRQQLGRGLAQEGLDRVEGHRAGQLARQRQDIPCRAAAVVAPAL